MFCVLFRGKTTENESVSAQTSTDKVQNIWRTKVYVNFLTFENVFFHFTFFCSLMEKHIYLLFWRKDTVFVAKLYRLYRKLELFNVYWSKIASKALGPRLLKVK